MPADDPFRLLDRSLGQAAAVVANIQPEQTHLPTPCTEFDVRSLVNHTVYDLRMFTTMVTGAGREAPGADLIGEDWAAAYQNASRSLLATWRQRGIEGTLKQGTGDSPASWAVGLQVAD